MKQQILLFLTLVTIQTSIASTLFRIQIGTYKQRETPENIKEIPNLGNFNLPQNYTALFSGGYYENYLGAKMRLNTVKSLGFEGAKLRVFRYGKLLDLLEGQKYIAKEELKLAEGKADETNINKQVYSLDRSVSMENRQILYDEISIPPPSEEELARVTKEAQEDNSMVDNLKGKFVGFFSKTEDTDESNSTSSEDEADIKDVQSNEVAGNVQEAESDQSTEDSKSSEPSPLQKKKDSEEALTKAEVESDSSEEIVEDSEEEVPEKEVIQESTPTEPTTEDQPKDDIDEEAHAMVEELIEKGTEKIDVDDPRIRSSGDLPFFKIYLGSNVKGGDTPESIENLPEIVYVYDEKKVIIYTVGYYGTSAEAEKEVKRYIQQGFGKAKVVGVYRGIIISNEIAKAIVEKAR